MDKKLTVKKTTDIADPVQDFGQMFEKVVIGNDLSTLTPQERYEYYNRLCDALGLNAITRPFEYIKLNNKLTLYATKECSNQLRKLYEISIEVAKVEVVGKNLLVWARAILPSGRYDTDCGSVPNSGNANDIMKCMTKAKRRVTLSICGLGQLDETEIETIPRSVAKPMVMFKYCPLCQLKSYNIELDHCEQCGNSWKQIQTQLNEKLLKCPFGCGEYQYSPLQKKCLACGVTVESFRLAQETKK